ncbi:MULTISPECIES: pyridoxal phosphate-dependent aminotransferase [unclassified Methanoregula]|uniref:pyridoxal phosphate-dependent aminotransferase n=1 Tax=unclassified Methanoregula TaxID=2649730 RepID=UPI0009CD7C8B|nr:MULTISPECIES: aminotransferase class I/II-fold pyridoxal phosphate-dependent enzyme [unclassified Methanoregula]OPX64571.1 MAG: Aspartate aminotransferase [Methanoregula sp. PtaB.Bin085]OPY33324.1 MAG: Aspartate aminotransferase [Methanoregula sp. PtaU1.Bin006]
MKTARSGTRLPARKAAGTPYFPARPSRADSFTESVIREMTRLALQHNAINLAQGFPDFPCPPELKMAACDALHADINQYAITWGAKDLRDALARRVKQYNGMAYDPETEITVTCGSTEAMMAGLLATIRPGDEVIVPEPFYENYGPDTQISGAVPRYVRLGEDFAIDEEAWKAAFTKKSRAIIINTPNNPTGKVFSRSELSFIADLCIDHNMVAITDEIYEHILYDGKRHVSIAALPGMRDRTITIGSFSKTYSVTGWRVGYALAGREITSRLRKIHDFLTVGAPAPLQHACVTALELPESYYRELARDYDRKRKILYNGLKKAGFSCELPEGAYYIFSDIAGFGMDDVTFARHLVEKAGVAAVPGSSFFHEGGKTKLRFTFSKKDETLLEACRRLSQL